MQFAAQPFELEDRSPQMRVPEGCAIVIFGATGDLTRRMIVPALFSLQQRGLLPDDFAIVGFSRSKWNTAVFREEMETAVREYAGATTIDGTAWKDFAQRLHYISGNYGSRKDFEQLAELLGRVSDEHSCGGNYVFYLSTPPSVYSDVIQQLGAVGLHQANGERSSWRRVVIEKPFGRDLATAQTLNAQIANVFAETQTYRIDHYLGKETVQNILVFRLANHIFEPLWNRRYVDHVQITASESIGIEHRAGYYEESGAMRDMFQNHLLQLYSLVAMDPPVVFDAEEVGAEKIKVLRATRPIPLTQIDQWAVRGQYGPGWSRGEYVKGYREEENTDPHSNRETFAALKLYIDNWRWEGVPFYLRSGKSMTKKVTEIAIQFKRVPHLLFGLTPADALNPNAIVIRVQPNEGFSLQFRVKSPGQTIRVHQVSMNFDYESLFNGEAPPAYETLLLDIMRGDRTLFAHSEWIEYAWALITPIIEAWESSPASNFPNYEAGSWGPPEADALIAMDGRSWRRP